jgi:hypothetical protein
MTSLAPSTPRPALEALGAIDVGDPESVFTYGSSGADDALVVITNVLAAVHPDPVYLRSVEDALGELTTPDDVRLCEASRRRGLRVWTPDDDIAPHRWASRLIADAFENDGALLRALAHPGPVDGPRFQLSALLYDVHATALGEWDTNDPGAGPHAQMPIVSESPFRAPAARAFAQLLSRGEASCEDLAAASRRGWIRPSWARDTASAGPELDDEHVVSALVASLGPVLREGEMWHAQDLSDWLVGLAGERKLEAAVPCLGAAFAARDRLLADAAGDALTNIATPASHAALGQALPALLDASWPADTWRARLALRGAMQTGTSSSETLGVFFTAPALSTEDGRRRAERVFDLRSGKGPREPLFEADRGWLALAASLLEGPLAGPARAFLDTFDPEAVRAAIRESQGLTHG